MAPVQVVEKEAGGEAASAPTAATASKRKKPEAPGGGAAAIATSPAKKVAALEGKVKEEPLTSSPAKQAKQIKTEKVEVKKVEPKKHIDVYKDILSLESRESEERPAEQDNVLFSQTCSQLRNFMKDLYEMKVKNAESGEKADLTETRIQACLLFVTMKKLNRLEKLRIRSSRENTNTSKQNVDAFNLQLQNLRYEVLHLKKEVSRCINFRSADETVSMVPVAQFYAEAPQEISQPETTTDDGHAQRLARLAWELETRKKLDSQAQELEDVKNKREEVINQKEEKIRQLGPKLKNIIEASKPVQEYLNIPADYEREQKTMARLLPVPLYILYTQVDGYARACDNSVTVEVEGDEEAARIIRENGPDSPSDEEEEEEEKEAETEGKKKHRGKAGGAGGNRPHHQDRKRKIFREHPLHVVIRIKAEEGNGLELKVRYLLFLEIVTVHTKLQLSDPMAGEFLQASTLLSNLYDGDDGQSSPNLKNDHQLKEAGITGDLSKHMASLGQPYVWAQRLAGLDFLSGKGLADKNISHLHMENTIKAVKKRLMSRLALQTQLTGLESGKPVTPSTLPKHLVHKIPSVVVSKMKSCVPIDWEKYSQSPITASVIKHGTVESTDHFFRVIIHRGSAQVVTLVAIKADYPTVAPVFCLSINWEGDYTSENSEWVRDLAREVNLGWRDQLAPEEIDGSLLSFQLCRLMALFDLCLECLSKEKGDTPEFPARAELTETVRGKMRQFPLLFSPETGSFSHR